MTKPRRENPVGSSGLDPLMKVDHITKRPTSLSVCGEAK